MITVMNRGIRQPVVGKSFTQPRFGASSSTTNENYLSITRSIASLATQSLARSLAPLSVWPNSNTQNRLRRSKPSPETEKEIERLEKDILRRKAQLYDMEQVLPKKNGMYLKIILGDVNVSILNKNDK
uniref:Uncharacterized protein n=1 Tax=Timema genevievae TaxID=629358 RepID=A0A7R9JRA4_TIMGE|nr:unnamed protein product [Timema genevievae]